MTYSDLLFGVWNDGNPSRFTPPPYIPLNYLTEAENGYLTQTTGWAATFATLPLPNTFTGTTSVRTALGAGPYISRLYDTSIGLYQVDNQDPTIDARQTKASENVRGRSARSALVAGAARRMYFAVDHNWLYQGAIAINMGISAWYLDLGFNGTTDALSLVYDGQAGTTTHGTTYVLGNTGAWKEAVWTFTDPYFGGRLLTLNGSTFGDFYLTHPDSADLWISEVIATQAPTTSTTYFYLVGPNNTTNVQRALTSKTLQSGGRVSGVARLSATGAYTPNGGSPTPTP